MDLPDWTEAAGDRDCVKVFHPHCRWDRPESIVLDDDGYARVKNNQTLLYFLLEHPLNRHGLEL